MKKISKLLKVLGVVLLTAGLGVSCNEQSDEYDEQGRLIISARNLYFNEWSGGDSYTNYIQDKFNVSINPSPYSWASWDEQVNSAANGDSLTDIFHFSLDSYNFENSYKYWAEGGVTKALPDDMSKWPLLKKSIESCTNIDALKIDGKLYCIPIIKNVNETSIDYSPFTYVYRRDVAKKLGVAKANDEYTWSEFIELVNALYENHYKELSGSAAIADVEWGFPSLTNFYKQYPHIFGKDANGNVVNNYTTEEYLQGLDLAREWASGTKKYYGLAQYSANDGDMNEKYFSNRVGIFYENLSLSNYTTLRNNLMKINKNFTKEQLDDASALLKVKGPDGKYALEGAENWFSATFFNGDMSDEKLEKILDIMEWLLGEEGTQMAAYGIEGYDYNVVDGKVVLTEDGWEKDKNGKYISKYNGAKYLRYMVTLGYDMNDYDPLVDKDALSVLNAWYDDMNEAASKGELRVVRDDPQIEWAYTPTKAANSGKMLEDANAAVMKYAYGDMKGYTGGLDKNGYLASFNTSTWTTTLQELNAYIGK